MTLISIDEVLHETWLMVCQLRNGWQADDGAGLYRNACAQVEKARELLSAAGMAEQDIEHIRYAQCAVMDSAVMSRSIKDAGYEAWLTTPLQTRYFNSLGAGENLWERIRKVLQEPAPNIAVLTCFHRVLQLGFSGRYREQDAPDREAVLATLAQRVPPFTLALDAPLVSRSTLSRVQIGAGALWWGALVGVTVLGMLWWGLNQNLQQLVQQQLP
ncbi:MAG: type VI secretion system protein TssL, short form [Pseudomonas sp.]